MSEINVTPFVDVVLVLLIIFMVITPMLQRGKPVAPGSYESAAIILLSDGRRTTGVDTLQAAKMAAERGVRNAAHGVLDSYFAVSDQALAMPKRPEFLVWPETAS